MSQVKIGHLVRLNGDLTVDHSVPSLPIFQGANCIGRNSLSLTDKRVSRKHISLQTSNDGSAEVTVVRSTRHQSILHILCYN